MNHIIVDADKCADPIAVLQLAALQYIQINHLEADFNYYMIEGGEYKHNLKYQLIDFIIQYSELHYLKGGRP